MGIDAQLARARALHAANDLRGARAAYEDILREVPESADALHFLGILNFQENRTGEAIALLERAVALLPGYADAHNNLGNIHLSIGDFDTACACYERALAIDPRRVDTHNNLGVLARYVGDLDASLQHLRYVVQAAPEWADAHYNLGNTLVASGDVPAATAHYRTATRLAPEFAPALRRLATALYAEGRIGEAAEVFRNWLALDPEQPIALHMLAATTGEQVPPRASEAYLRTTFDQFAVSFDGLLEKLHYAGPGLVQETLARLLPPPGASLEVLDAGCGTGLCGPVLKPYARSLTGVDIAPRMLERAAARGAYTRLECADLEAWLDRQAARFDLVLAADVLVYFGDLAGVFAGIARSLRAGGHFLCTLERLAVDDWPGGYRLGPHGRYQHAGSAVDSLLDAAGFDLLERREVVVRHELNAPVASWLVAARRRSVVE